MRSTSSRYLSSPPNAPVVTQISTAAPPTTVTHCSESGGKGENGEMLWLLAKAVVSHCAFFSGGSPLRQTGQWSFCSRDLSLLLLLFSRLPTPVLPMSASHLHLEQAVRVATLQYRQSCLPTRHKDTNITILTCFTIEYPRSLWSIHCDCGRRCWCYC